jgi:membrane protease YdiL (CAAX protease family)
MMVQERAVVRRGLVVYLALSFSLAWAAQVGVVLLLRPGGPNQSPIDPGAFLPVVALMWPPAVGAFVARQFVEGHNFADAGLRWPPWRYVLIAWFLPAGLTLATIVISLPWYPLDGDLSALRQASPNQSPWPVLLSQVALGLTIAVPINSLFAFGEEFGWRGYLLPRLQQLWGYWPGLLGQGAIWGLWHAPLILLTGYNYPRHHVLGVVLFVVFGALAGTIVGWLRLASDSLVPPTIIHAANNAIGALPIVLLRNVDTAVGGVLSSALGCVVLLVAIAWLVATHRLPPPRFARGLQR